MAKRFTDTEKWNKVWFRKLNLTNKCFWQYILDNCNQAGIWEVDFERAAFFVGSKINEKEMRSVFEKQFTELAGGKRWFINDFIYFQYGTIIEELNPKSVVHKSVIALLEKARVTKGLPNPCASTKDKDKDKDKDKHLSLGELRKNLEDKVFVNRAPKNGKTD